MDRYYVTKENVTKENVTKENVTKENVTKENNKWQLSKEENSATSKKEIFEQTYLFIEDQFGSGEIRGEGFGHQEYTYKRKDDPQNIRG